MNPFSVWTLATGGIVVSCGWLILLLTVHRMLHRRTRKPPVRSSAPRSHRGYAPGRAYTSRAAYGGGLARGPVVAAAEADGAATTSLLPLAPAAAVLRGGGLRAGRVSTPLGPAGPATVRFDGAPVAGAPEGWAPVTITLPVRAMPRASEPAVAGHERGRVYDTHRVGVASCA